MSAALAPPRAVAPVPRRGRAAALPKPAARFLTSEQFLDWLEPGLHADLIGGEIHMHSPVSLRHAHLVNFLDRLLAGYLEETGLGVLHRETVAVRLSVRETFLPDLSYFTKSQAARLLPSHAPFAPTFVAEVLSPATVDHDRQRKFAAYELHGVQEYWLLDPDGLDHRFHRRAGDMLAEFAAGASRIESAAIPGFWVRRDWLNPDRPPRVADCLAQLRRGARRRTRAPR